MKWICKDVGGKLELVPEEKAPPKEQQFVIDDECDAFQSMADCKHYTSKARYRQSLREQGYIEVGNDVDGFKPVNPFETYQYNKQLKEDVARSYYEVRDKMAPLSDLDRERCRRMDRDRKRHDYDRRERHRDGRLRG